MFDVSDPASPVAGGFASTGLSPSSVAISAAHVFVVNATGNSLQVFALAGIGDPLRRWRSGHGR
ncbi:MAG: hypothetical protein IPH53_19500 [Flavobacteriales bacterium]|nr:hypothetical protein [Flavobacteriales bacterium]